MANEYGQYFADKARFLCPASVFVCACRWNITLLYSRIIHAHSIFFSHQHLPQRNTGRKVLVGGEWRQRRENNDFTLWKKKKVLLCEIFCSSGKKVIIEEWDGLGIEGGGGEAIEGITFWQFSERNVIWLNKTLKVEGHSMKSALLGLFWGYDWSGSCHLGL